ncbi:hypothetical protein ACLB2K_012245 [Fragaria x ananassa]
MLRHRKNMLQKKKDMVKIEKKEKMIERKKKETEKEKQRQNKNMGNGCSSWQAPPEDVMEKILQFVEFADQRRLGQVSKSWRVNKYVRFLTFPESKLSKGKVVRPGDEKWSVFSVSDYLIDILFSSGTLYALVRSEQNDGGVAPTHTLNFALHDAEHLKLKVVFDKHEYTNDIVEAYDRDCKIVSNAAYLSMLLESTSKEVLLIHHIVDYVLKRINDGDEHINENGANHGLDNDGDDEDIDGFEENNDAEADDEEVVDANTKNVRHHTSSFRTYKRDPYNSFHMMFSPFPLVISKE